MQSRFSRSEMIIGKDGMQRLSAAKVAVFGVGGVGGYVVEALARSGIGAIDVIDNDTVALSNINRQILATTSTVGRFKADVAAERIRDINPDCIVGAYKVFYLPEETEDLFDFTQYDYVVDAIDTVTGKIAIVSNAKKHGVPVISCMGAGNKTDPTAFIVTDISKTSVCPLAKVMRRELKKRGITSLKVVYSKEEAVKPFDLKEDEKKEGGVKRRATPGSVAFVPSVAGLIIAGEVIKDISGYEKRKE